MKIKYIFLFMLVIIIVVAGVLINNSLSKSTDNSYAVNSATLMLTAPTVNSAPIYFLPKGKTVECKYNNNGFSMCSWTFDNREAPIFGWTALKDLSKK